MKTYAKKFNAQRAARAELGDDAIKGVDYRTVKSKDGWTWERGKKSTPPKPEQIFDSAATKSGAVDIGDLSPETHPIAAANRDSWNAIPAIRNARREGKRAAIEQAARDGVLPEPPDFSAETHKRFRNKLVNLVELAKSGDLDGMKAMVINPVSSSPKAMARYRDLCVIALEARQERA